MTGVLTIPNNRIQVGDGGIVDSGKANSDLDFGDAVISTDGGESYDHASEDGEAGIHGVVLKRGDKEEIESGDPVAVLISGMAKVEASDEIKDGELAILDGSNDGQLKKGSDTAELSTVFGICKKGADSDEIIVEVL